MLEAMLAVLWPAVFFARLASQRRQPGGSTCDIPGRSISEHRGHRGLLVECGLISPPWLSRCEWRSILREAKLELKLALHCSDPATTALSALCMCCCLHSTALQRSIDQCCRRRRASKSSWA